MEVQDRMRNWYANAVGRKQCACKHGCHINGLINSATDQDDEHISCGEKRGALRRKNDDGNVRERGRPKIRWLDGVRVIPKRRDCQGGSVRPSYIIRRTPTHKTVGLK